MEAQVNGDYVVYMLTLPDGKGYIGLTRDFKARWRSHGVSSSKSAISKAIQACGKKNVKREILHAGLSIGKLPLDINIQTEHTRVFIPITSMFVISLILNLLMRLFNR